MAPLCPVGAPAFALSNDAAVYKPEPGRELVFTKDTLVAGIHFFANDPADLVAKKALRVNLSDLAAMGAKPEGYLLSLSLPKEEFDLENWIREFAAGLKEDQLEYSCDLWGGDTVSTTGPITISITGIGSVDNGQFASRATANVGDQIYVSGNLGDSAVGLGILNGEYDTEENDYFIRKYHLPTPRISLGVALIPNVNAMMDISDGLIGDMSHIVKQSGVGANIFINKIPESEPFGNLLETKNKYSHLKLFGGDDYELLFTAPKQHEELILKTGKMQDVNLTIIGEITADKKISFLNGDGSLVDIGNERGFRHF